MVLILPKVKGFGEQIGESLGGGIQKGADFFQQMQMEKYKQNQRKNLINEIEGGSSVQQQPQDMKQKFLEALPEIEQAVGRELTPQDLDQLWEGMNQPQKFAEEMQKDPVVEAQRRAKQYAAAGEHDLAQQAMKEAELSQKRLLAEKKFKQEEIGRGYEESKPTRTRGREILEDLPYKENALITMKDAIESGNLGMFSFDNLAEITGIEGLRSPEGAAFKTASKEFFLGNLSRVGSRGLNQMMEKVVLEMSPLIGRKPEANLAVTEILGAENDVTRKEAELIHDIGQDYKEKFGHYPDDLSDRVYKELRPYAQQRQKDALSEVDRIKEMYEPKNKQGILMYDPSGNLRRVPHKNRKEALKEGYRIP